MADCRHKWHYSSYPVADSNPPIYTRGCIKCGEIQRQQDRFTDGKWHKVRTAEGLELERLKQRNAE